MIRQRIVEMKSRYKSGALMYPGKYVQTWLRVKGVWHLIALEPVP